IRSASETFFVFLPLECELLKFLWIASSVRSTFASRAGWLTSQSFWGSRRIRAPFAPPRLSEPRNVAAEAQAVPTSSEIECPDARIWRLRSEERRVGKEWSTRLSQNA